MAWQIPGPDTVYWPAAPSWAGWWRALMLSCAAAVMVGCGIYFWLHDSRALVYAFGAIVVLLLLFAGIAGWWMYRYGVLLEHADGTSRYNGMQEAQWQSWAQEGLMVSAVSSIFPDAARSPRDNSEPVATDTPLQLPECPGMTSLFAELLTPLRATLQIFIRNQSLEVCLPEEATQEDWQSFQSVWHSLSLPLSAIQLSPMLAGSFPGQMALWQQQSAFRSGWLVIRHNWHSDAEGTQGAIAWLVTHPDTTTGLQPGVMLHRLLPTDSSFPDADMAQFLQYQCVSKTMKYLWSDEVSQPHISRLMMALNQHHKADTVPDEPATAPPELPSQQYLPHWLGQTKACEAWFAVTQAIQMAEHTRKTQVLALAKEDEAFLMSVSNRGEHVA